MMIKSRLAKLEQASKPEKNILVIIKSDDELMPEQQSQIDEANGREIIIVSFV